MNKARTSDFPDDFFDPPQERPPWWPDEPVLRRALDWFKTKIPEQRWRKRRLAAAERLYRATLRDLAPGDRGRLFDAADTMGWYLFTAEASLDHIQNYDFAWGSRVIPVFLAIGRDLDHLKAVAGIEDRLARLMNGEKGQPNGALFEMLVAIAYRKRGATVSFVPETPGRGRTYDLLVEMEGLTFAVECKRMEVGDYGEAERDIMRQRWGPLAVTFAEFGRSIFADLHFYVPLADIPEDYLRARAIAYRLGGERGETWDDAIGRGVIRPLDLTPLAEALKTTLVAASSTRLVELLTGDYVRNGAYSTILHTTSGENPRYVEGCDLAVVMRWATDAPAAIDAKARDIRRKLFEANDQLADDIPGVIHIGWEAVEGDSVEAARNAKILETAAQFDPRGKPLEFVYCHYLVPEVPPDESWAFDETTQWLPIRPHRLTPIADLFLITPPDAQTRHGGHWTASKR